MSCYMSFSVGLNPTILQLNSPCSRRVLTICSISSFLSFTNYMYMYHVIMSQALCNFKQSLNLLKAGGVYMKYDVNIVG